MKRMCPPIYPHSGFVATHALGHMMYGSTLLVKMNQKVLNKQTNERNISSHKGSTTHSVIKSHKRKMSVYIYVIMKTMCPLSYHHNGFVATHALGPLMYGSTLLVPMNQRMLNKQSKERNISCHK